MRVVRSAVQCARGLLCRARSSSVSATAASRWRAGCAPRLAPCAWPTRAPNRLAATRWRATAADASSSVARFRRATAAGGAIWSRVSPGSSPAQPAGSGAAEGSAQAQDRSASANIELFARELARLKAERDYAPRVVGVTGTNGKTTTTRLDRPAASSAAGQQRRGRRQHRPAGARALMRALEPQRCPKCGCSSCRASSWRPREPRAATRRPC